MTKDDMFIVEGNFLSVPGDFPVAWKSDVVDSLLFSQLYADSNANRFDDAGGWYKSYRKSMGHVKWEQQAYNGNGFTPENGDVVVLKDLIEEKMGFLEGGRLEYLLYCIRHFVREKLRHAALRQEEVTGVGEKRDVVVSTISLQLSVVEQGAIVYSMVVNFRTSEEVEADFFVQKFLGKHVVGKVNVDVSEQVLNKADYEKDGMRKKIAGHLSGKKEAGIVEIFSE